MKKENVNVGICPPCGENVGLPTKRGFLNKAPSFTTPHRPYGALPPQVGKLTACGFTLIELLVVVLIIGILAAVAVPQYQKAVEKARMAEGLHIASTLQKGVEAYILENGFCSGSECVNPKFHQDLDISIPSTLDEGSRYCPSITCARTKNFMYYAGRYDSTYYIEVCRFPNADDTKTENASNTNLTYYSIRLRKRRNTQKWEKEYVQKVGAKVNLKPDFEALGFTVE